VPLNAYLFMQVSAPPLPARTIPVTVPDVAVPAKTSVSSASVPFAGRCHVPTIELLLLMPLLQAASNTTANAPNTLFMIKPPFRPTPPLRRGPLAAASRCCQSGRAVDRARGEFAAPVEHEIAARAARHADHPDRLETIRGRRRHAIERADPFEPTDRRPASA